MGNVCCNAIGSPSKNGHERDAGVPARYRFEMNSAASQPRPTWLRQPQRMLLRRALFQVHLWVGLVVTLYAMVIGITGSMLVFKEDIERHAEAGLYHVAPVVSRASQRSLDATIHDIEHERPGWKVFALSNMDHEGRAAEALMIERGAARTENYRVVSFDRADGHVVLDRKRYDGWLGWIDNLHVYLLSGETGLRVSGWMAVGLLVLCVTGLVLWWPGVRRWTSALMLRGRASWRRLNWDLHAVTGFWTSLIFIVLIVTGIELAFPGPVGSLLEIATGGSFSARRAAEDAVSRPVVASAGDPISVDAAMAAALRALPVDAPPGYLSLSSGSAVPFFVIGYYRGAAPFAQLVRVEIDPHTGQVLGLSNTREQTRGLRMQQYFVTTHFGSFGGSGFFGVMVKILWSLTGLAPVILAVTGVVMYWNRTLRPALRRTR